jgi:hypothetical protein
MKVEQRERQNNGKKNKTLFEVINVYEIDMR